MDEKIHGVAEIFGVEAKLLLTHMLVYLIDVNNADLLNNRSEKTSEDLMELRGGIEKPALNKKLDEMENKLLSRIDKVDSTNYFSENINE